MNREFIEISTDGKVSVLGASIGMSKQLSKEILKPKEHEKWEVIEGDNFLWVWYYGEDRRTHIKYDYKNDTITKIRIARYGTKDKKLRDTFKSFYASQFKRCKHKNKDNETTIYNTGVNEATLKADCARLSSGMWYGLDITITKFNSPTNRKYMKDTLTNTLRFIAAPIVATLVSLLLYWIFQKIIVFPYTLSWFWLIGYGLFFIPFAERMFSMLETILIVANWFIIKGKTWIAILPIIIYAAVGLFLIYVTTIGVYKGCKLNGIEYGAKEVIASIINIGIIASPFKALILTSFIKQDEE